MSDGHDPRQRTTPSIAVALAVVIYAIRHALPNPNEGITNLYAIPIAILAVRFGAVGGAVAALVSLGLFGIWEKSADDVVVGFPGYVSRGVAFLVLGIIVGRFASQRRTLIARLEELATTDALTGLLNRTAFEEELAVELARSRRHGRPGALLFSDLDGFKVINDTLGHRAGDEVLRQVASVFRQELRAIDTIGRIGGDEFALLLPDTTCEGASAVAQKLRSTVASVLREAGGQPIALGVSVGCVEFDGRTPESAVNLLQAADEAMYRDKNSRRA